MIELNKKTQQDFLNREWVQKLLDAGVDMSDAKYRIYNAFNGKDYITLKSQLISYVTANNIIPTYTVSELLYKLHEYVHLYEMEEVSAPLSFTKDASFYIFSYYFHNKYGNRVKSIESCHEYPIYSLAKLLIQCHEQGIGDVGDISDK